MVAAPMAAAPKRPAVGEPADSPTTAVKRLRDEESAQAAPEPEIRTIDYGQITAGMAGGGWLTTTPRQITPRQEKLFATLFSAVAFVSVVSGAVMPVTPPTGTRQLAEAETLGIYRCAQAFNCPYFPRFFSIFSRFPLDFWLCFLDSWRPDAENGRKMGENG